jgi:ribosomal protein S25
VTAAAAAAAAAEEEEEEEKKKKKKEEEEEWESFPILTEENLKMLTNVYWSRPHCS